MISWVNCVSFQPVGTPLPALVCGNGIINQKPKNLIMVRTRRGKILRNPRRSGVS